MHVSGTLSAVAECGCSGEFTSSPASFREKTSQSSDTQQFQRSDLTSGFRDFRVDGTNPQMLSHAYFLDGGPYKSWGLCHLL